MSSWHAAPYLVVLTPGSQYHPEGWNVLSSLYSISGSVLLRISCFPFWTVLLMALILLCFSPIFADETVTGTVYYPAFVSIMV